MSPPVSVLSKLSKASPNSGEKHVSRRSAHRGRSLNNTGPLSLNAPDRLKISHIKTESIKNPFFQFVNLWVDIKNSMFHRIPLEFSQNLVSAELKHTTTVLRSEGIP